MPNLVGFRDGSPPLSKDETLKAMQMEALGLQRIEVLYTADSKENKASYVPTVDLESQRLVNKSSVGEGVKSRLHDWNNAYEHLQDDGTNSQKLQDVNEGKGQTHRAKLMNDDRVREYKGEANSRGGRGGNFGRGRASSRGGRGKAKGERRVTFHEVPLVESLTRVRVPKGNHVTAQTNEPRRQPAPILKSISAVKPAKGNIKTPNVPAASIRRPIGRYDGVLAAPSAFMASIGTRNERTQDEPRNKVASSAAYSSKDEAAKHNIDASISTVTTATSPSKKKARAHKANTSAPDIPSVEATTAAGKPEADLMDFDIGQENVQPVLKFTAPSMKKQPADHAVEAPPTFDQTIEALERTGKLTAAHLETLKSIQRQVHARENSTTPVTEAPRQGTYTNSELVSLRPAAKTQKVTTGIAAKFAKQQEAFLIGEHVHKTRYHNAASLTEDFENLSVSDEKPAKPAATDLPTTAKSKINPFGPPPAKSKGLSLPPHLLNQAPPADHGAAARAQYSTSNDTLDAIQSTSDETSTTRPKRRNMINETGFIALAEKNVNSVGAGKK